MCFYLLWTGPRARILKLPMSWCKQDEGTHRFLWPMQDGPRGYILCHPASYTALTRTKLVPAKASEGTISLFLSPRHRGEQRCVMLCSFSKWQRFPSNWKPAANTDVLFGLELVTPLRHRLGVTRCNLPDVLPLQEPSKILFCRHVTVSFFLFLSSRSFRQTFPF